MLWIMVVLRADQDSSSSQDSVSVGFQTQAVSYAHCGLGLVVIWEQVHVQVVTSEPLTLAEAPAGTVCVLEPKK